MWGQIAATVASSIAGKMFGGKKTKQIEPLASRKAREELLKRGKENVRVPRREIAGLSPLEQWAAQYATQYAKSPVPGAYDTAAKLAQAFATGKNDFLNSREWQALQGTIMRQGEELGRRLTRGLTLKGNSPITSSKGRDVLGRSVTDIQQQLMTAALPYIEQDRQRQFAAIPLMANLEQAKAQAQLSRLDVGENVGQKLRLLEQAIKDSQYNQIMQQLQYRYQIQPQILSSATTTPATYQQSSVLDNISKGLAFGKNLAGMLGFGK